MAQHLHCKFRSHTAFRYLSNRQTLRSCYTALVCCPGNKANKDVSSRTWLSWVCRNFWHSSPLGVAGDGTANITGRLYSDSRCTVDMIYSSTKAIVVELSLTMLWYRWREKPLPVAADGCMPAILIFGGLWFYLHCCEYLAIFKICNTIAATKINTVKPFNLAAQKIGDLACKIILYPTGSRRCKMLWT